MRDPMLTNDNSELLMKDVACERCGLTEWKSFEALKDIRCGGCGLWFITELLAGLDVDESECQLVTSAKKEDSMH